MHIPFKSAIFIGFLIIAVIFFVGFRAGTYVEHVNKIYIPLPTLAQVTPVAENNSQPKIPSPTLSYARISVKECNISFVLPSYFKQLSAAPEEAEFQSGNDHVLVSCDQAFVQHQRELLSKDTAVVKTPLVTTDKEYVASQASVITQNTPLIYKTKVSSIFIQRNSQRKLVLIEVPLSLTYLIQETILLD